MNNNLSSNLAFKYGILSILCKKNPVWQCRNDLFVSSYSEKFTNCLTSLYAEIKSKLIHIEFDMFIHCVTFHLFGISGNKVITCKRVFVGIFQTSANYPVNFQCNIF